jgi:copper chaperone NosL
MGVTDARFASQIVVAGDEPRFFDDLGCLTRYLADPVNVIPPNAGVFVADHRTTSWVRANQAMFTRVEAVHAAMGSHIIAHESTASRDADPDAKNGAPVDRKTVLGTR